MKKTLKKQSKNQKKKAVINSKNGQIFMAMKLKGKFSVFKVILNNYWYSFKF